MKDTIREIFDTAVKNYPKLDAISFIKDGEVVTKTYPELDADVRRIAGALADMGFAKSHIALVGKSSYYWGSAYLGITCGGAVAVPIDALLQDEEILGAGIINQIQVNGPRYPAFLRIRTRQVCARLCQKSAPM